MQTKVIDNFGGRLTRFSDGDMNSGLVKYQTSWGLDPFSDPNNLTFFENAVQIDPNETVITDLIMAGKARVESGITYVYCIGHLGRLYKIQVNDPTTYNSNYDNPVLIATLATNSPTFTRGGFIDFYGATEKIYIGHDKGVTSINFDGTGEAFIGAVGTWTQTVPRPLKQFIGKLYVGNGNNIAEIDTTGTVTTYTRLSPSFPTGTQVRDLDTSLDGNYMQAVVARLALPNLLSTTQDTSFISNQESYIFRWNGIDQGYTAFDNFPSFSLNSNIVFGQSQYTFGYDIAGSAVFNPVYKILSPVLAQAPLPNALGSNGNLIAWATTEFYNGFSRAAQYYYGSLDNEVGIGWWRPFMFAATGTETDVLRVPFQMLVSNFGIGASNNGYAGNVFSNGKQYFSTLEVSAAPTVKYKLYKWFPVPTTVGTAVNGVYETQNQIFSRKITPKEIRIYGQPWVTNNSFQVDLIGSDGNVIANGSKTFTVGTNLTAGLDFAWYNPGIVPVYVMGIRITNLGSKNLTIMKIEIDYDQAGK